MRESIAGRNEPKDCSEGCAKSNERYRIEHSFSPTILSQDTKTNKLYFVNKFLLCQNGHTELASFVELGAGFLARDDIGRLF